ncbi:MAG TPA: fumarylacetoacetate hydrolase family protein [Pyrinomonadaceae bacterium]|nr:fumarylacetoacetate hydrolase family protein [Pyrinomonadaceae bacterium]
MKLFRFGEVGREKPGAILLDSKRLEVSAFGQDYDEQFFATDGIKRLEGWLTEHADECPVVGEGVRLGPCIARPSKIICIGLNYARHAAEGGLEIPKEPVIFFKASSALSGPNDDVIIPKGSQKTDWEVELAVIIGKRASYVSKEEANKYIAGYALHNDYSEREFQLERGGQWVKGKSCDTFAPLGPFLVTRDEVPDPHNLHLWLKVNGEVLQDANTSDLIFDVPTLISYLSGFMSLLPGDVISTGTPAGVGLGLKPPRFLNHGDIVELGIDSLGSSKQRALAYEVSLTS